MSDRLRVLITDFLDETSVESPVLDDLADLVLVRGCRESDLAPYAESADAMILFHEIDHVGEATFSRTPRCRGIVRAGVGYNNVDLAAAGSRGIAVCNVPDYGTEEVADHSIMMLIALARRLIHCDATIRRGVWDYQTALGSPRLRGKTLGLVGCGRIGTATALRAKALGMDVVFYDPFVVPGTEKALGIRRAATLEALLEQSPFLSIHCYLDATTYHLINEAALSRLPQGAYLINTARGPIVDQEALLSALDSGRLAGAALDVVEREPLDDDRLRNHPKVILTPHSAFYSVEGFVELRRKAAEEVRRLLCREPPLNLVNRSLLKEPLRFSC